MTILIPKIGDTVEVEGNITPQIVLAVDIEAGTFTAKPPRYMIKKYKDVEDKKESYPFDRITVIISFKKIIISNKSGTC